MAINFTGEEKIDLLLKKVAYGVSKTGTSNTKGPNGESFTSFKAIAPQHVWKEANTTNITASPPATSTAYIGVYGLDGADSDFTSTGSKIAPKKATAVANAQQMPDFSDFKRAWNTGVTNWLGPAFGSAYAVKVYVGGASWDGATNTMDSNGITEIIFGDDPSRDWFFDYEAGILYWTNEQGSDSGNNGNYDDSVDFDNPDAAYINDGDVVYIGGWTYIGATGVGGDGISLGTDFDGFATLESNVLEFDDQSGRKVLASPSDGTSGAVSFRALVAADIPTLNQDTTGTADKVTVTDSTADTAFPVTFHDESNGLLDDTGSFTYNPTGSVVTATTFVGNVTGDLTGNADTVTTNANLSGVITSSGNTTSFGSFSVATLSSALSDVTLSGNNTGDQTITLTGDVTGGGTGTFTATIPDDTVTYAKMQDLGTANRLLGGTATGTIAEVQVATDMITDEAVTLAKMAHMSTNSFLGRDTDGDGDVEVLSASAVRGILNVEDGADVTDAANVAAAGAVLTSTNQTISGTKTFSSTISGSIDGNAATVTNGVYTTSSVTALSDVTDAGSGAIITGTERTKLNGIEESADVTDAANVAAAGAVMNTGDETIAGSKTFSSTILGNLQGNVTGQVSDLSNHDTGDLTEGSNLYYTDARARAAISLTDAGGDGSASYDNSTGVITYTGPSAAETRAHFSAGTGVTITDGAIAIGQAVGTSDSVTFAGLTAGNTFINGNLTVDGNVIQKNTSTMRVEDALIELGVPLDNADSDSVLLTANYTANALIGFEVILQTDSESTVGITNKAALVYDHVSGSTTIDKWKFGYDSAGSVVYDNVTSLKFGVTDTNAPADQDGDADAMLTTDEANAESVRSIGAIAKCTIDITSETNNAATNDNYAPEAKAAGGYPIKHNLNTLSVVVHAIQTHDSTGTELGDPISIICKYIPEDATTVRVFLPRAQEDEKYDIIVIG